MSMLAPGSPDRPNHSTALSAPDEFRSRIHDLSDAVLYALERRHLEYLDLDHFPASEEDSLPPLNPGDLQMLRIEQIGHGTGMDRSLDILNMQNVLGTFREGRHSFVFGLRSTGPQVHMYMGARRMTDTESTRRSRGALPGERLAPDYAAFDFVQNLRHSIEGNLPGTTFHSYDRADRVVCPANEVLDQIIQPIQDFPFLSAITGIPSLRTDRQDQSAQSLDRFIQAMQGKPYLVLVIAEPVPDRQINDVLSDCLRMNSDVHSWVKTSYGHTDGTSTGTTSSESSGENSGGSSGSNKNESSGRADTKQGGAVLGGALGAGVSLLMATTLHLSAGLAYAPIAIGGMVNTMVTGRKGSASDNISNSFGTNESRSWGESMTKTSGSSDGTSNSRSVNFEYLNKTAEYCEKVIDGYVERLQKAKNLGLWNVGVYLLAEDASTFAQGNAQLRALFSGKSSHQEPIRSLNLSAPGARDRVGRVLESLTNPIVSLLMPGSGEEIPHPLGKLHRGLSTPLNTEELSLFVNLPRREMPGLKLQLFTDFGLNPKPVNSADSISLGKVVDSGRELNIPVGIDSGDLTRHLFVTGITGSGKTNTCFRILKSLSRREIPFLVLEPAKGEYRDLLAHQDVPGLKVYTLGHEMISPFRINPFQFVPGTNLVSHLDNLKSIFNASFPMYASMPYMLEEAVQQCYEERGWNLIDSSNSNFDMEAVVEKWRNGEMDYSYADWLPTLTDLFHMIDKVIKKTGFNQEIGGNFSAALRARIKSLLLGSKGCMLDVRCGLPYEQLYNAPTILELRGVGDDDDKCFLMALILVQLYQYREQLHRWNPDARLKHLTVLEESHRLLGQSGGPTGVSEVANPRGKAADSFANMLAEIREYGEGFLIVDQTPAKLIPDVIKNTSAKILHRLSSPDDRQTMGAAMGMSDDQQKMIPRLRVGEAIFFSQDQEKPVWIRIPRCKGGGEVRVTDADVMETMKSSVADIRAADKARLLRIEQETKDREAAEKDAMKLRPKETKTATKPVAAKPTWGVPAAPSPAAPASAHAPAASPVVPPATTTPKPPPVPTSHMELFLTPEEAAKGCERSVLVFGKQKSIKIRPGVVHGSRIRYTGIGATGVDGRVSDLVITVCTRD